MKLAGFLAMATAAAALASQMVGPVAVVMQQVARRSHPAIKKFNRVGAQYRQVLRWSDLP
jgi:hypothetical protein